MTEKDTPELTLNDGLTIGAMFGFAVGVLMTLITVGFVALAFAGRCG
jgi:hypothetical protein